MKRLFALLVAIVIALVAYAPTSAQPCLFLEHSHNLDSNYQGWSNPDSVLVDTCCSTEIQEECLHANRYFEVQMDYDMYPFDHVLDSGEVRPASEIIPALQSFKEGILALENQLGKIYFKGLDTHTDTNSLKGNPLLFVYFERYQRIVEAEAAISALPNVKNFSYFNRYALLLGAKEKENYCDFVFPNPSFHFICINELEVGEEYKIYNSYGSLVLSGLLTVDKTINVERLSPGVYVIVTKNGAERFVKK